MAKVSNVKTAAQGPGATQELIAAAAAEHTVTDTSGRVITLRKPGILAQYRLIDALGNSARNEVYVGMVMPVLFVAQIDNVPISPLRTKAEVEALIQQLEDVGMEAVMAGVKEHFGKADAEAEAESVKK